MPAEKSGHDSARAGIGFGDTSDDLEPLNVSGHPDQLRRQYGLLSTCSLAITVDNAWVAFAGSLSVALQNGGPPGIIYEFIVACVYYCFIAVCVAELGSAIPSSGGVYHWASITPGKRYGRVNGFFAGSLNFFGWAFGLASITNIAANVAVQLYATGDSAYEVQTKHAYAAYVCILWLSTLLVVFGNRILPYFQRGALAVILGGLVVTVVVVVSMPTPSASNSFVWSDFQNRVGWSDGVAFLTGVLNGAFAIGTCDSVTHLAEELPNPRRDLPRAIFAQVATGFVLVFVYAVAILYNITDLDAVISTNQSLPIAEVYAQATGSPAAVVGLLVIIFLCLLSCVVSTTVTTGRLWWTLARDRATPFASLFAQVPEGWSCPIPAQIFVSLLATAFGGIAIASPLAFANLVGSFIVLTTTSIFLAIFPNLLTSGSHVPRGPFNLGAAAPLVHGFTCILIVFFNIIFCFPPVYPVEVGLMNWNSVIVVGLTVLTALWWVIGAGRRYDGPKLADLRLAEFSR